MRRKLFILSAICLIVFATTSVQAEPQTTSRKNLSLAELHSPNHLPNMANNGKNQFSSNYWSSSSCSNTIMKNKIWDKTKKIWNGPLVNAATKITTKSDNGFLAWVAIHSFFDSIADAKAHSRGKMTYFSGDGDWHIWKNCQDISLIMATVSFSRRVFIERIPLKVAFKDLCKAGLIRFVIHNTTMKIVKGGFSAYNDPYYNQHTLPYWGFKDGKLTDKYIRTGRVTTPVADGFAVIGFSLLKWKFN